MRKPGLIFASLALLVSTAGLWNYPTAAAPQGVAFGAARVSSEQISRHIAYLASDKLQGRRAGTGGADEAARYIADRFREYKLTPASSSGFLQSFTFVSGVRAGSGNSFRVTGASGARALKMREDFMPLAFSSSEPASGQLVHAGYGISAPELQYDSYKGVDVSGKIVLIRRGSPDGDNPHGRFAAHVAPGLEIQNKTLKAREKGAKGVIIISDEQELGRDSLSRLRFDLNFLDAGIPAVVVSGKVADSLVASAAPAGSGQSEARAASFAVPNTSVQFKTDVVRIEGKAANVVGIVPGSDPQMKSEYVVIGAHYDHLGLGGPESLAATAEDQIHHGADDNASGTSALLELARVLAAAPPRRSVVFMAFSAEEIGLLGSAAYTKNPAVPLASTVAMINMDMVGRLRDQSLFVGGVGTSPAWKPLLEKLNGGAGFKLATGEDGFGPSDHQSFYVRDIPVLFFFTGSHNDYHKPSDTAEKINTEGTRRIAEFVREVTLSVANEPQRIAFTKVKSETRPTGRGFRVYLGTVPNYSDQSDGMKLDGVRPGSPAERAGLKAGDVIVRLASVQIKNVYDYTYALGELRPNEEIDVLIRRDGKEMSLKLTPDKRQ
ncbi:MAG TPA: M28 family peptidase [Blastocatellia bacterium]|nr:M28 family peptidase [Blastocatellia bacterium]